jgi:hypothetical protein
MESLRRECIFNYRSETSVMKNKSRRRSGASPVRWRIRFGGIVPPGVLHRMDRDCRVLDS